MAGIYVHIPFCKDKCAYCDFASYPREIGKAEAYFACLYKEIKYRAETLKDVEFDTIYFGGGTPSFVDPKYILGAMNLIAKSFKIKKNPEITLEVNPGTIDAQKLEVYKKARINRFSIGLQSCDDQMLRRLNRVHTAEQYKQACELLKGYNLSADVMIGLEGQTQEDVVKSIDFAVEGGVSHISVYALQPEEGTPMYGRYLNGDLPDADTVADMYDTAVKHLKTLGFDRYEVSNFAKDGKFSKHNLNYWKRGQYIGFGVSASSFIGNRRFTNTEKIDEYVHCLLNDKYAEIFSEEIEGEERKFEYVMLAMRTAFGVNLAEYSKEFGSDFMQDFKDKLPKIKKYLDFTPSCVKIKDEYLFVQNNIIIYLMD